MSYDKLLLTVCEWILAETPKKTEAAEDRIREMMEKIQAEPPMDDLESMTRKVLLEVGVGTRLRGHRYLVRAICMVAEDFHAADALHKQLYPTIAEEFGTTGSAVERAILHAIESAFTNMGWDVQMKYFGCVTSSTKGKATNGEFITRLADVVREKRRKA